MRPMTPALLLLTLAGVLAPGQPATADDPAPPLKWTLHPSALIHYDRVAVTTVKGKIVRSRAARVTVSGHDLRDEGQYTPVSPTRTDLPAILALRLATPGKADTKWKTTLGFPKTAVVRLKGQTRIVKTAADATHLEGTWTFASRGGGERGDTHQIKRGKATVTSVFDPASGHIRTAKVVLEYRRSKLKASSADKPERVDATYEFKLKRRYDFRYDGFQKDVDKAIDSGTNRLMGLQIPAGEEHAGSYKPHGAHRVGSTALAVLTLSACDVPRTDPRVALALEWLLAHKPKRTYARALCLMAFDKAFTEKPTGAARRRGRPQHGKQLTPAQRRWCREVADELVRSASTPGTWGYPSNARTSRLVFDTSNTQYAVLGMRAADRLGFEIEERSWLGVVRYCELVRERKPLPGAVRLVRQGEAVHDDGRYANARPPEKVKAAGGFRYSTLDGHRSPWASMTCAGIASLAIARNALERLRSAKLTTAMKREIKEMMLGGWAWLEQHWGMDRHPRKAGNGWYEYYLYSVERAAILDNVKRVGLKDWYVEGALQLILRQAKDGAWGRGKGDRLSETCFALLFLKRATAPLEVVTGG